MSFLFFWSGKLCGKFSPNRAVNMKLIKSVLHKRRLLRAASLTHAAKVLLFARGIPVPCTCMSCVYETRFFLRTLHLWASACMWIQFQLRVVLRLLVLNASKTDSLQGCNNRWKKDAKPRHCYAIVKTREKSLISTHFLITFFSAFFCVEREKWKGSEKFFLNYTFGVCCKMKNCVTVQLRADKILNFKDFLWNLRMLKIVVLIRYLFISESVSLNF